MPYLKFSRDRRGYESTYLLHAGRRQSGERPRLLYWFRSPPHVKVGRAAFDEDAIRELEAHHPDLPFDWSHILQARPPAAPEPRERDGRPPRRDKGERRPREQRRPPSADRATAAPVRSTPARDQSPPPEPSKPPAPVQEPPSERPAPSIQAPAPPPPVEEEPPFPAQPRRRLVRVFDVDAQPPAPPAHHATDPPVVDQVLGRETAEMLRGRYAEVLVRIRTRVTDPARADALREEAERVNPDTWVTEEDVRVAAAQVENLHAELRRLIGGRRRRRRRGREQDASGGGAGSSATPAASGMPDEGTGDERGEPDAGDDDET